jgi:hypothetical protein
LKADNDDDDDDPEGDYPDVLRGCVTTVNYQG